MLSSEPKISSLAKPIDELAQQCVKCGLCLPHCPTYQVALNENESPRGRIALMQGAVRKQVPMTEKLQYHIDTCLACRACEAVCPAGVKYESLYTTSRAWMSADRKSDWREEILIKILENPSYRRWLTRLVRFYQSIPLPRFLAKPLQRLRFLGILNAIPKPKKYKKISMPKRNTKKKGTVLLLQPCASAVLDPKTLQDAEKILLFLGWEIIKSEPSYCCGALSLHTGHLEKAKECATQQVNQYKKSNADVILTLASGCHNTIQEYKNEPIGIPLPSTPIFTLEEFILNELQDIPLNSLKEKIVVQIPCTLRNGIRKPELLSEFMKQIPGIEILTTPAKMGCCGAAGTYFLRHSDIADKLASNFVDFIRKEKPNKWVTSNIGCAVHIQQALKQEGIEIPVFHPISLIVQQLSAE